MAETDTNNVVAQFDRFVSERHKLKRLVLIYFVLGVIGGYAGQIASNKTKYPDNPIAQNQFLIDFFMLLTIFAVTVIVVLMFYRLSKAQKYLNITQEELGHLWQRVRLVERTLFSQNSLLLNQGDTWFKLNDSKYDDVYLGLDPSGGLSFVFQNPMQLPHVVALVNNPNKPETLKLLGAKEAQKLEGDFPGSYKVYYPEEANIEALNILSPDNMQQLMMLEAAINFETVDNVFVMKTDSLQPSPELLAEFVEAGENTLAEFDREMQTQVDEYGSMHIKAVSPERGIKRLFRSLYNLVYEVLARLSQLGSSFTTIFLLFFLGLILGAPFYIGIKIAMLLG